MLKMKSGWRENLFSAVLYIILIGFTIIVFYPFYLSVILSFNDGTDAVKGGIFFWPRVFTLSNYEFVFSNPQIGGAAIISVLRTFTGTISTLVITSSFAYAVSKPRLMFRKFYMIAGLITMYFGGGLIPFYLLIRDLNLFNNFLVYILPNLFGMYNAIIFITFFREIPASLEESARIDGANDLLIFLRIFIPISTPVYATIALFAGVGQWNSWFDTMMYTNKPGLNTLSHLLTKMINQQQFVKDLSKSMSGNISSMAMSVTPTALMLATMVVTTFPIIVLYPFLQKYFVKGIMIGSVKE